MRSPQGVAGLFKKNKVTRYTGHARLVGPGRVVGQERRRGDRDLRPSTSCIATGSKVAPLRGVELDGDRIGTSTEALSYPEVPEHLVVIGAGYIGLEMGSVWRRLGSKVTVLEYLDRILPGMDAEIAQEAQKILEKQGFEFQLGTRVTGARVEERRLRRRDRRRRTDRVRPRAGRGRPRSEHRGSRARQRRHHARRARTHPGRRALSHHSARDLRRSAT